MKKTKPIFDKVEMELIKADIEMLKAEEKNSGAWRKWLDSQEMWDNNKFKSNREVCDESLYSKRNAILTYGPDPRLPAKEPIIKPRMVKPRIVRPKSTKK